MNKLLMNLTMLMRELWMAEGILKNQKGVHMVIKGSYSKKNNFENTKQKGKFRKGVRRARKSASTSFMKRNATRSVLNS